MAYLSDLPDELVTQIIEIMESTSDALAFASTCSAFSAHRDETLYKHLHDVRGREVYGMSSDVEVYDLIEGHNVTIQKVTPFWFGDVSREVDSAAGATATSTSVNIHFGRALSEHLENGYILVDKNKLSIHRADKVLRDASAGKYFRRTYKVIWEKFPKSKLIKNSGSLLRRAYECWTCNGSRSVCPGCGGFSTRFPELFASCGWDMPCPICIGINTASEAKDIYKATLSEQRREALKSFWNELRSECQL